MSQRNKTKKEVGEEGWTAGGEGGGVRRGWGGVGVGRELKKKKK